MKPCGKWIYKVHDFHNRDIFPHTITKDIFRVQNNIINQHVEKGQPRGADWPFRQKNNFETHNAFSMKAQKFIIRGVYDLLCFYNFLKKEIEDTFMHALHKFTKQRTVPTVTLQSFGFWYVNNFGHSSAGWAIGWIVD